jgi:hypothetical protein
MYTEICPELGKATAATSSAPNIQFHLMLGLLLRNSNEKYPGLPEKLPKTGLRDAVYWRKNDNFAHDRVNERYRI